MRNELQGLGRNYYTQALKLNGNDVFIPTTWFFADGLRVTDNKKELKVSLVPELRATLKRIEEIAIESGLRLPVEFQTSYSNSEVFKPLPDRDTFNLKLQYDAACFDTAGKIVKFDTLSMGDYRAMVHVKGLYIGSHPSGKLVSLQLRITQIQYMPRVPQCMFSAIPVSSPSMTPSLPISASRNGVPETPQPGVEAAPLSQPSKRGRKPAKLQRQNAVNAKDMTKIQAEDKRKVDAIPSDFFHDTLMDLTDLTSSSTN